MAAEVDEVNIARLIVREFKRISWPVSDLVVQPPGGKTLVNTGDVAHHQVLDLLRLEERGHEVDVYEPEHGWSLSNLLADVLYASLDPRIRFG